MTDETNLNLLDFERNICMEVLADNTLVVVGKGMSCTRLLAALVHTFSHPSCLVVIVNCSSKQEVYVKNHVKNLKMPCDVNLLRDVANAAKRTTLYYSGGVFFMPSQMLIYDMLVQRIPTEKITGIIVMKAHKLDSCSKEAFVVRLYREMNSEGFLQAFSNQPIGFFQGFSKPANVMNNLMLNKILLYPRFHVVVKDSLERNAIEVTEHLVKMGPSGVTIQSAIFSLLKICLNDLKTHIQIPLDTPINMFDIQTYLTYHHLSLFKTVFDPLWHLLNLRSKTLLYDVRFLCELLDDLTKLDCVTFNQKITSFYQELQLNKLSNCEIFVNSMGRSSFKPSYSYWIQAEPSTKLFDESYRRVISFMNSLMSKSYSEDSGYSWLQLLHPKWFHLFQLCETIRKDRNSARILVLTKNEFGVSQMEALLRQPFQLYRRYGLFAINQKLASQKRIDKLNKTQVGKKLVIPTADSFQQFYRSIDSAKSKRCDESLEAALDSNCTVIHFDESVDLDQQLSLEYKPTHVVVYDLKLEVVRQLEIYRNLYPNNDFVVHILYPDGSTDTKKYQIDIKTENEAFKMLIEYKAQMPLKQANNPENIQLGLRAAEGPLKKSPTKSALIGNEPPDFVTDMRPATDQPASAKQYSSSQPATNTAPNKIVVDLREFNSKLPFLIYNAGIKIIPKQLEIADYIICSDTAIERKSLTDLVASLDDGRLYNQARNLTKNFSRPILLIEFDNNKSTKSLRNKMFRSINNFSVQSKIAELVMNFPQLALVWSMSPVMSVDLFLTLKVNRADPVESEYLDCQFNTYSAEEKMNSSKKKASTELKEIVKKLACITHTQIIPRNSPVPLSLLSLVNMGPEEMTHFLANNKWAESVVNFFNAIKLPDQPQPINQNIGSSSRSQNLVDHLLFQFFHVLLHLGKIFLPLKQTRE